MKNSLTTQEKSIKNIHPLYLFFLAVSWCLFEENLSLLNFIFGLFLAYSILWFTRKFWPYQFKVKKPWLATKLLFTFIYDIIEANIQVVKLTFSWRIKLNPVLLEIPLDIDNDLAITLYAFMITLTPGTLSVEVSEDRKHLLVHCINVTKPEEEGRKIKRHFEKPLKELLICSELPSS